MTRAITLSSGLVGVVVDDDSFSCDLGNVPHGVISTCGCAVQRYIRAATVAALLRDPANTSRSLLDIPAASKLTEEDYKAFWDALGYKIVFGAEVVTIEGKQYTPCKKGGQTVMMLWSSCKNPWDHSTGTPIAPDVLARWKSTEGNRDAQYLA